MKLKFIILYCS